jgi:FHA domain
MPKLRVTAGGAAGSEISLDQEFAIGRSAEGLGKLGDDPQLSRRHARVARDPGGQVFIEDLGSTNGTFVNDQRISGRQALNPGDRIRVGHTQLSLQGDAAPAPPPAPAPAAPGGFAPQQQAASMPPTQPLAPAAPPPAAGLPAAPPPAPPPGYGAQAPAPQHPGAKPGPGGGVKAVAIIGGVLMLLWAAVVGIVTVEVLKADEFEVRDGDLYQTTGTDKAIAGIFGVPSALIGLSVLPAAIYFAVTSKRGRLVAILAIVSILVGLAGFGILAAD